MKKLITFALLMGSILNGYSQADNHLYGPVPYRTMQETIGETFIVLPLKKTEQAYDMLQQNNGDKLTPVTAGKSLKLIGIDPDKSYAHFKDSIGVTYRCQIYKNSFFELVPLIDIENAKKQFVNKTLWLNSDKIFIGDPLDGKLKDHVANLRFEPITVTAILLTSYADFPFQFIVKTAKNQVGYVSTNVSATNTSLNIENFFESNFFLKDPKLIYHFTPKEWATVKAGYVEIGMSSDAVRLVDGPPIRINRTKTAKSVTEQWVYGKTVTRNLYFTNGRLTTIQD